MQDSARGDSLSIFDGVSRVDQWFDRIVKARPSETALVWNNQEISFETLSEMADDIARQLSALPDDEIFVAVSARPSFGMVAAVLGVLKSGKAFLPLDPNTPAERLRDMIGTSGVKTFLGENDRELFAGIGLKDALNFNPVSKPADMNIKDYAYVMFTSGSAGNSKAVPVSHTSLLNYVRNAVELYSDPGNTDLSGFFHLSLTFDASLTALFAALCTGKKLVLASWAYPNKFKDPALLEHAPYDFIKITPLQLFEMEAAGDERIFHLTEKYVIGGEDLLYSDLKVLSKRNVRAEVWNEYGPTETCIGCMVKSVKLPLSEIPASHAVSLGRPMKGLEVHVLDENGRNAMPGSTGEICIAGIQLSEGYIGNTELSSVSFTDIIVDDRKVRVYRTGDLAWRDETGELYFQCRKERPGRNRTAKVGVNELEASIAALQGVKHVYARLKCVSGKVFAVAYITIASDMTGHIALRQKLRKLAHANRHSLLVILLKEFPMTPHKKINRRALPDVGKIMECLATQQSRRTGNCRELLEPPLFFMHIHWPEFKSSWKETDLMSRRVKKVFSVRVMSGFLLLSDQVKGREADTSFKNHIPAHPNLMVSKNYLE